MSGLLAALRLMTVLPLGAGSSSDRAIAVSPAFFPIVGALIGLASAGVFVAAAEVLPVPVAAALAVVVPVFLTGALHLDGLADTADGLFGARTRERRLEIMVDPHVGAYGVSAIVIDLLVRWSVVASLEPATGWPVLVVAGVLSRGTVAVVIAMFPYIRKEGIGSAYAGRARAIVPVAVIISVALAVTFGGVPALAALGAAATGGLVVAGYARRSIGGVTGDIYGAVVEVSELAALLTLSALLFATWDIGAIW